MRGRSLKLYGMVETEDAGEKGEVEVIGEEREDSSLIIPQRTAGIFLDFILERYVFRHIVYTCSRPRRNVSLCFTSSLPSFALDRRPDRHTTGLQCKRKRLP